MTKIFILLLLLINPSVINYNNNFEGTIEVQKSTDFEFSSYVYHVKDNLIRVEEFDSKKNLQNVLLLDLKKQSIIAISPKYKAYRRLKTNPYVHSKSANYEVVKTDIRKNINGQTCYQWRVRNKQLNSEIAYWVANMNLSFWDDMLKLMNKTENNYNFFLKIPDSDGFVPILSVERTLVRHEKGRYAISDIKKNTVDAELFSIPADYALIQD